MAKDSELVRPQEAADIAHVSRSTINNALRNRTLPGQQDNQRRWAIRRSDVLAWAAENYPHKLANTNDNANDKVDDTKGNTTDETDNLIKISRLEEQLKAAERVAAERDRLVLQLVAARADDKERITSLEAERRELTQRLVDAPAKSRGLFGFLKR